MNLFSISQLAQFSGIKPHTIRVWEKRYHALDPTRSEGNTRYYNSNQLRRLLNIVSLVQLNYKISQVGSMTDKELYRAIETNTYQSVPEGTEYFVLHLTRAALSYDEQQFDKIFAHCILRYGLTETYKKILYPMMIRTGLMWSCNTMPPANEHFITNLIRQKMSTAIDSLPHPELNSETWLLFLPEDEFHEIGLLFAHYIIRLSGKRVIYLGTNMPADSLAVTAKDAQVNKLLLFLVHRHTTKKLQDYINKLNKSLTGKEIYVAAGESIMKQIKFPKNIQWLKTAEALENALA
ncbi:MAG TPA: MerR family transcriptional regulator [Parafilimonas sp.]|nr:MerR family transcriptional regulator [Parafilimonas sp.]